MTKELVVAAYDKSLGWLNLIDSTTRITVYRKGDYPQQVKNEIKMNDNVGRCVHSFFSHIYNRYESLSDITFFVQDYPFDHWEDVIEVINNDTYLERCQLNIGGYYGFHFNTITVPSSLGGVMWSLSPSKQHGNGNVLVCKSNGQPQDSNPKINVDSYWNLLFDDERPYEYEFIPGGHFAVTRDHVHLRSKEFYKKVVELLSTDETAPWMIERLECYIFNPKVK